MDEIKSFLSVLDFVIKNPYTIFVVISIAMILIPTWISKIIKDKLKDHTEALVETIKDTINVRISCVEEDLDEVIKVQKTFDSKVEEVTKKIDNFNQEYEEKIRKAPRRNIKKQKLLDEINGVRKAKEVFAGL